ncbi:hypothetical protein C8J57DRAFT_1721503 [Mycena rebaudengoi]|nr:hypothetical protein C8J57DRAFT_1721503 [Mycena rebaudengoi]
MCRSRARIENSRTTSTQCAHRYSATGPSSDSSAGEGHKVLVLYLARDLNVPVKVRAHTHALFSWTASARSRRALAPSACLASAPLATSTACSTPSRHVGAFLPLPPPLPPPRLYRAPPPHIPRVHSIHLRRASLTSTAAAHA